MSETVVVGARAVEEALTQGHGVNRVVFARESQVRRHEAILEAAKSLGARIEYVPLAKLNQITKTSDHQGVAAFLTPAHYRPIQELIPEFADTALVLILDHVQHARNTGMLIRSAAGAGVAAVVLPQRGGALVDQTVIRASAGTALHVPLVTAPNLANTIRLLKKADFWIYGLDASAKQSVFTFQWPKRTALVVGNETKGLRPVIAKLCDDMLNIPLADGVESLNAAVAGSIALFQAARAEG
jgi:23S rRNA (guanosine2251-2'-O)-methyltransferase